MGTERGTPSARVATKSNAMLIVVPINTDLRILRMSGSEAKRHMPRYKPKTRKHEICTGRIIPRLIKSVDFVEGTNCSRRSQYARYHAVGIISKSWASAAHCDFSQLGIIWFLMFLGEWIGFVSMKNEYLWLRELRMILCSSLIASIYRYNL